jgi:hypothetical protein
MNMTTLTKTDIAALRKCDDICVHLGARHPEGLVRAIKRKGYGNTDPFATDIEHIVTAKVEIDTLRGRQALETGGVECFAMIGVYHSQHTGQSSILKTLRAEDELTFRFYPDAHTNGYVAMGGLHADVLYLDVRRDGKIIARWELDISICPSNSARMCRGVPNSESYARDASEARQVA